MTHSGERYRWRVHDESDTLRKDFDLRTRVWNITTADEEGKLNLVVDVRRDAIMIQVELLKDGDK